MNLFLAEIKQDPIVLRKFPIPERGEISRDENEKRMKRDFPPLLDVLVKKFKRKFHSDGDLEKIPDDIDELKRRFWIKIPENHLQSKKNLPKSGTINKRRQIFFREIELFLYFTSFFMRYNNN